MTQTAYDSAEADVVRIGDLIRIRGFITRELPLLGKPLEEIERLLGFRGGLLDQGAWVAALQRLPDNREFRLAGYTYWLNGEPTGGRAPLNFDEEIVKNSLRQDKWRLSGAGRLVKVMPIGPAGRTEDYIIGKGIEQWVLETPIIAQLVIHITPGAAYPKFHGVGYR